METETGKHQETKKDRKMPTPQERNLVRPIAYNQMIDALVKKKKRLSFTKWVSNIIFLYL